MFALFGVLARFPNTTKKSAAINYIVEIINGVEHASLSQNIKRVNETNIQNVTKYWQLKTAKHDTSLKTCMSCVYFALNYYFFVLRAWETTLSLKEICWSWRTSSGNLWNFLNTIMCHFKDGAPTCSFQHQKYNNMTAWILFKANDASSLFKASMLYCTNLTDSLIFPKCHCKVVCITAI